ncbi:S-DNA-T family DNA segregation ATPase FtsK/SpoIIIE [Bacillus ectoiniformans]|uniref:DNA translocase FtsK n=1 Tax=Bacillus ectoiniformans TaxID=1494429 RepID=UPI00195CEB15|nr:DNA translocase FtsK [Bacillus ectoiniformans]MBM7649654.1 S-DNA-T family DNA segregation ATPase FtsK/SpoIIIE [Bacillus ectoiniformans]
MSMFKKFMGLFREEIEVELEPGQQPGEENRPSKKLMSAKREQNAKPFQSANQTDHQELAAKIAYQYPTREYPLPGGRYASDRKRRKQPEPQAAPSKKRYSSHSQSQNGGQKQEPERIETSHHRISSRPFQPTEIPSPIYGFKQRPTQQEMRRQISMDEGPVISSIDKLRIKDDPLLELGNKKEHFPAASDIPLAKPVEKVSEQPLNGSAEKDPLLLFKKEPARTAYDVEAEITASPRPASLPADVVETVEEPVRKEQEERLTPPFTKDEPLHPLELEVSEEVNQEHTHEMPSLESQQNEQGKEEISAPAEHFEGKLPEEGRTSRSEERKRKRRHSPFNVIMSKQDRENLQRKKTRDSDHQESVKNSDSHRAAAINEGRMQDSEVRKVKVSEEAASKQIHASSRAEATNISLEQEETVIEQASEYQEEQPVQNVQVPSPVEGMNEIVEKEETFLQHKEDLEDHQSVNQPAAVQKAVALEEPVNDYEFPRKSYLNPPVYQEASFEYVERQSHVLNETFKNFNVKAKVVNVTVGPSVTRFEVEPEPGVKVSKITNLSDDIKLSLAAKTLRIEAPIPGTRVIGIEVPNKDSRPVLISEILSSSAFQDNSSPLTSALGLDISGEPAVLDLKKMPHGLIAGATGSGKSVCINSILVSLLYKAKPHELKLLLIDPKMVELAPYNGIPHLVSPVITDVKAATAALKWAVEEMERRYELFAHAAVRDIAKYNEKAEKLGQKSEHLPYIVIIIDELADLMMMSPSEVEESICRIAQKARACGIHLIVATQRPSVDVITGLIKANIPTRIAFSVSSQVDSRTIIDTGGAEKLLGRGDMLFLNNGSSESVRLQGTFVSDEEIDTVVDHVRREKEPNYLFKQEELLQKAQIQETEDSLFPEACEFVVQHGGASTSLLQRHFKVGYNRASRLIEMMEEQGLVSEQRAGKPREVLITEEELETLNEASTI